MPAGTVLFLGAGFSAAAGTPLAADLMTPVEFAHSKRAAKVQEIVLRAWADWRATHPEAATEEFITAVYERDPPQAPVLWPLLIRFLAYRLANPLARFHGQKPVGDNILEAALSPAHKEWWDGLLGLTDGGMDLAVITTNWDIWVERALRPRPMRRPPRPGFHCGWGPERLVASRAFPTSRWGWDPWIEGSVALLKLHGSLNWAVKDGTLLRYGDCRPALRGDAAIVPPAKHKLPPTWGMGLWAMAREALSAAQRVLIVGYSLPDYDDSVRDLLRAGLSSSQARVHVFDLVPEVVRQRLAALLPGVDVAAHPGLPAGTGHLRDAFRRATTPS